MEVTAIASDSTGRVIYVAAHEDVNSGRGGGLYRSTDSGKSWIRYTDLPAKNLNVNAILIDPARPNIVYIGTEAGGLLTSSDSGAHLYWRTVGRPRPGFPHGEQINSLSLGPDGKTLWAGTRRDGVFVSTNGGITWTSRGLQHRYVDEVLADQTVSNRVYAAESGVVSAERNNSVPATFIRTSGHGWTRIAALPREWTLVTGLRSDALYAWRRETIEFSTDHGSTWSRLVTFH
jgi:hypothetical protein